MRIALIFVALLPVALFVSQRFDLAAFKEQFQTEVVQPYRSGLAIVSTGIIEYLAVHPIPTNWLESQRIVQHLETKARLLCDQFNRSSMATDTLRRQLDSRVLQLVSDGSRIEGQILRNREQEAHVRAVINQTEAQVEDAGKEVNKSVVSLRYAESTHAAAKRHEYSMNCEPIMDAHDEGFFEILFKAPFRIVFGLPCVLFNTVTGRISDADAAERSARRHWLAAQTKFDNLTRQLQGLEQRQFTLFNETIDLASMRANLSDHLNTTNDERQRVIEINVALKSIMVHIGSLFGKSRVLKDVVAKLIDMDAMIGPIEAIGQQIVSYTGEQEDSGVVAEAKRKIRLNLPLVKQRLPQYGLIIG